MKGYTWNLRGDHSYDGSAAVGYDIIIHSYCSLDCGSKPSLVRLPFTFGSNFILRLFDIISYW